MKLYSNLPSRSPMASLTRLEPDGHEYREFLSAREFCILPKGTILWNGAPTELSLRQYQQGTPINHAAMALIQAGAANLDRNVLGAPVLRGPVFLGRKHTWFHNFEAPGTEDDLNRVIKQVPLQGAVRVSFLGWNFKRKILPMSCVSCESDTDFIYLRLMLAG